MMTASERARQEQIADFQRMRHIISAICAHQDELMTVIGKISSDLGDQLVTVRRSNEGKDDAEQFSDEEMARIRDHIILIYTGAFLTSRLPDADCIGHEVNVAFAQGWASGQDVSIQRHDRAQ